MAVFKIKHKYDRVERIWLSKKDMKSGKFQLLLNRRKKVLKTVKGVLELLRTGQNFDTPFIASERANKLWYLIDGNNRYIAIEKFFDDNSTAEIEITVFVYTGLSIKEEKELFTQWNSGKKQSTSDVIQQYAEDIPLLQKLLKQPLAISTSIYSNGGVTFFKLMSAYMDVVKPTFSGGYMGSPWDFIDDVNRLNVDITYSELKDFLEFYYGIFSDDKYWLRTTPLTSLMKIYFENRLCVPPATMTYDFKMTIKDEIPKKSQISKDLEERFSASGRGATILARNFLVQLLNSKRPKPLYVAS